MSEQHLNILQITNEKKSKLQTNFDYQLSKQRIKMSKKYIELINGALRNEDNTSRTEYEKALVEERSRDPVTFFTTCAQLLTEGDDMFIRTSASTLLCNSIVFKPNGETCLWDLASTEAKNQIKQQVLGILVSVDDMMVKLAANVISKITFIEIPRGEWLDLIDILAENTSHTQLSIRKASITAIGSICQQLHYQSGVVNERTCEQFLGGIIMGTRESETTIIETALTALKNSLCFLQPIMCQNSGARDEVFKLLLHRISKTDDIQLLYEVFFEFVKSCYDYLDKYMHEIQKMTIAHLSGRNQASVLSMELWESLGNQYLERMEQMKGRVHNTHKMNNYLLDAEDNLLPEIMSCLLIENQKDFEFPEMRESALKVLGSFVACGVEKTIDKIAQGVNTVICSKNIGHRQATVLLFSTLCESMNKEYVLSYLRAGFDPMFALIRDEQSVVVSNSLSGLATIAEIYPEIFYTHQEIKRMIHELLSLLGSANPSIVQNSLNVIRFVSDGASSKTASSIIYTDPMVLLQPMVLYFEQQLDRFEKDKQRQSRQKAVIIIMNCLMKSRNRGIGIELIHFLTKKYFSIVEINHVDKEMMLESILAVLHTAILTLEGTVPNMDTLNTITNLLGYHVQRFGVEAEGLNIMSALAIVYGHLVESKVDEYWNYIIHGLSFIQHAKTFRSALHSAGDYGRIYKEQLQHRIMDLMNRLMSMIHTSIPRQYKIDVIATIADFVLGLKISVEAFIDELLKITDLSIGAIYVMTNNPGDKDYVEDLKNVLVEMLTCMAFSLVAPVPNRKMLQYFPKIIQFASITCSREANPSVLYLKSCLYLLFDLGSFFSKDMKNQQTIWQLLNDPRVYELLVLLQHFKNQPEIQQLKNFIQKTNILQH